MRIDMYTMKEAKDLGIIPKPWHNVFKDKCPTCGKDRIINSKRTRVTCSDPRCITKVSYRCSKMLKNFGIIGIGQATCLKILEQNWEQNKFKSHIDIFRYVESDLPYELSGVHGDFILDNIHSAFSKRFTLATLYSMIAIPGFDKTSLRVFEGCNSFVQLRDAIKRYGSVELFLWQFGITDKEKIESLEVFLKDLFLAWYMFKDNLIGYAGTNMKVVITERVHIDGVYYTKKEFINKCNELCTLDNGKRVLSVTLSSATQSVPFIISDGNPNMPGSAKHNIGRERGVLITGDNFIKYLKERVANV